MLSFHFRTRRPPGLDGPPKDRTSVLKVGPIPAFPRGLSTDPIKTGVI